MLAKFPRIKEACLDIINKDGQDYAVVKADLVRTRPGAATIRPKLPDGTRADTRVVRVSPGFRVLVDGKETRVEDLAVGQELTAYVKVTQPQMALAPADNSCSHSGTFGCFEVLLTTAMTSGACMKRFFSAST